MLTATVPAVTSAAAARPAAALVATAPTPAVMRPAEPRRGSRCTGCASAPRWHQRRPRLQPPAAPRTGAAAPRRAAPAEPAEWPAVREEKLVEERQRTDRRQRGERAVGLAHLALEDLAAAAVLDVAADRRALLAAQALGDLGELLADLVAAQQPRLGSLRERDARAHEQRLDARDGGLHRLGDLLVGERVHLAQDQRRALASRAGRGCRRAAGGTPRARAPCRRCVAPCSAKWMSIESTPTALLRRRWFRQRLRAMR